MGTWNVRSMNQGELEVVKQEIARININILEIGEIKWTGMGEFNSDDHYTPAPTTRLSCQHVLSQNSSPDKLGLDTINGGVFFFNWGWGAGRKH